MNNIRRMWTAALVALAVMVTVTPAPAQSRRRPSAATLAAPSRPTPPVPAPTPAPVTVAPPATPLEPVPAAEPEPAQVTREEVSEGIQFALHAGYGSLLRGGLLTNHLAFGVGASIGYTLPGPVRLHLGVEGMYHLGSSEEDASAPAPATQSGRATHLSAVVGYDVTFGRFVVRPYALAGVVLAERIYECARCGIRDDTSETLPALGGGLYLGYFTRPIFVALDGRVAAVTFDNPKVLIHAQAIVGVAIR